MNDNHINLGDIKVAPSFGLTSKKASASKVGSNRFTACLHAVKRKLIRVRQNDISCTSFISRAANMVH